MDACFPGGIGERGVDAHIGAHEFSVHILVFGVHHGLGQPVVGDLVIDAHVFQLALHDGDHSALGIGLQGQRQDDMVGGREGV